MIDKNTTGNIKAIAIIMVMLGHLIGAKKIDINIAWLDIATFGVSMFLFVSGYGLYKSYETNGLNNYLKKKVKKVYIPFAIATIFVGMSRGFFGDKWSDIVKTIFFMNPSLPIDGTMWYIYFLALWYILFYIVFFLFSTNTTRLFILLLISIAIYNIPFSEKYNIASFLFPFHAFTFVIGVGFAMMGDIKKKARFIIGILLFSLFLYLFRFHFIKYDYLNHVITSIISAPAIILLFSCLNLNSLLLKFISSISYELYLFEGAFRHNNFAPDKTSSCILFFLITISCAYTFNIFIKMLSKHKYFLVR